MRTIQSHWESYALQVMPEEVSDIQVFETKQAFYAGVLALLTDLLEISGPEHSTDAGVHLLQGYLDELNAHMDRVNDSIILAESVTKAKKS